MSKSFYLQEDGQKLSFELDLHEEDVDGAMNRLVRRYIENVHGASFYKLASARHADRREKKVLQEAKKLFADALTEQIESFNHQLSNLLKLAVRTENVVNWNALIDRVKQEYYFPEKPQEPSLRGAPPKPKRSAPGYRPQLGLIDKLWPPRRRRKIEEMNEAYKCDLKRWEQIMEEEAVRLRVNYERQLDEWARENKRIRDARDRDVEEIQGLRREYENGERSAVEWAVAQILEQSTYPMEVGVEESEVNYNPEAKLIIIDAPIPPPEAIPKREAIRYVKTRDEFRAKDLSQRNFRKLYEAIPYQIALRTLYEVFDGDEAEVIEGAVFNGWVTSVNPATGHEQTVCTLSVQTNRQELMALNLASVDPKACFKSLKGVSASKLIEVAPVNPVMRVNREDSRFFEARDIGSQLEDGENLAAMDWEDFEHLVREVFEAEFSVGGGEVKITQASRDGGIDAVAFDPDPLRGGKIIIQAKRYTRTVSVSAVRELYGTVMNEGANTGILVTTSDYGPDAYNFAKDKPIQLLNGGNLLRLLERHGYNVRINTEEARKLFKR